MSRTTYKNDGVAKTDRDEKSLGRRSPALSRSRAGDVQRLHRHANPCLMQQTCKMSQSILAVDSTQRMKDAPAYCGRERALSEASALTQSPARNL